MFKLNNDWDTLLETEINSDIYLELREVLKKEYANNIVYPPMNEIFNALRLTSFHDTRVVILGQDPYHGANQANGLSFSVTSQMKIPPSLQNIFKELQEDCNIIIPNNGDLTPWAKQGVLLLNAVLTVREKTPNSHKDIGWEHFTDTIIQKLNEREEPIIFMLWGKNAQDKARHIDDKKHFVLKAPHPSPFSAYTGFFGCKHFSKANSILIQNNSEPINWQINNV